jgi:hypothetical protein
MEKVRIMGAIAFGGDLNPDSIGAAVALRRAGFEVIMMPEKFRLRLAHPEDDFMEASIEGIRDNKIVEAIMDEIDGDRRALWRSTAASAVPFRQTMSRSRCYSSNGNIASTDKDNKIGQQPGAARP